MEGSWKSEAVVADLKDDTDKYAAYEEASRTMGDNRLPESQNRGRTRVVQRSYGEGAVAWIMRFVPVFDTDESGFVSFDNYMWVFRATTEVPRATHRSAMTLSEPVAGILRPRQETITEMLGLDDLWATSWK